MEALLTALPVLALDCQATGPNPDRGHLLEIAWCRWPGPEPLSVHARLVRLPAGAGLPDRVSALTGLTPEDLTAAVPADERVWFASRDRDSLRQRPDARHRLGPLPNPDLFTPPNRPELDPEPPSERREAAEEHAARMLRRGRWLTRLVDCELVWQGRSGGFRALSIRAGHIISAQAVESLTPLTPLANPNRPRLARQACFDRQVLDRLRVLTTELKRLLAEQRPLALWLTRGPPLTESRLARILARV